MCLIILQVGSFTQNTAKETLQKTLQSIKHPDDAERTLFDEQRDLANIEEVKREQQRVLNAKTITYENAVKIMEGMRLEVERMEDRRKALQRLKLYEIKIAVEEAIAGRKVIDGKQAVLDEAKKVLKTAESAVRPMEIAKEKLIKEEEICRKSVEQAASAAQMCEKKAAKSKEYLEEEDESILMAKSELTLLDKIRKRDEQTLLTSQTALDTAAKLLEHHQKSIPDLQNVMADTKAKLVKYNNLESNLTDTVEDLKSELNEYENEIQKKKKKMNEFKSEREIFKQILFDLKSNSKEGKRMNDCLKVMDYLDREEDRLLQSGELQSKIYGPVGYYMKARSPIAAVLIEKSVPDRRLLSFISTCDSDNHFLKNLLKRLGVDLDVFNMKNLELPPLPLTQSTLDSLRVRTVRR